MRDVLALLENQRLAVTATVVRYGCRPKFAGLYEETILLQDVRTDAGALLTDHLWLRMGSALGAVDPQPGDILTFSARVRPYTKSKLYSRRDGRLLRIRAIPDYTLRYVTQVHKVPTQEAVQ